MTTYQQTREGRTEHGRALRYGSSPGPGPKSTLHLHQDGVENITGAEFVDGEAECIKAVRKQVGAGADWIKVPSIAFFYTSRPGSGGEELRWQ